MLCVYILYILWYPHIYIYECAMVKSAWDFLASDADARPIPRNIRTSSVASGDFFGKHVPSPSATIWLWHSHFAMENPPIFKNGKPSINGPSTNHGYVTNNQMLSFWKLFPSEVSMAQPYPRPGPTPISFEVIDLLAPSCWSCRWVVANSVISLAWFKGKSTGKQGFYHQI